MRKFIILPILAVAILFASCQKEEVPVDSVDDNLKINLSFGVKTKVSDSSFDINDEVGIYVVNNADGEEGVLVNSGNHYDNVRFTYSGSGWVSSTDTYWMDKSTPAVFYCYHPYGSPESVSAYLFSVKADQSTIANYKDSDFVWGKTSPITPTKDMIQIGTNHIMSNVVVYVQPGEGFTSEELDDADVCVRIRNIQTSALVNLSDGSVTATGSVGNIIMHNEDGSYRAVVIPQTVANGTALVGVEIDGTEYTLKKGFSFKSGVKHKFTINVNKTESGVKVEVGDWETDDEDYGGEAE